MSRSAFFREANRLVQVIHRFCAILFSSVTNSTSKDHTVITIFNGVVSNSYCGRTNTDESVRNVFSVATYTRGIGENMDKGICECTNNRRYFARACRFFCFSTTRLRGNRRNNCLYIIVRSPNCIRRRVLYFFSNRFLIVRRTKWCDFRVCCMQFNLYI